MTVTTSLIPQANFVASIRISLVSTVPVSNTRPSFTSTSTLKNIFSLLLKYKFLSLAAITVSSINVPTVLSSFATSTPFEIPPTAT